MIASFNNSLGLDTIRTLKNLTTYIQSIFCHPTMVDRIASMLNYLLLQLVGPKSKTLKVSRKFDKTIFIIFKLYVLPISGERSKDVSFRPCQSCIKYL